MQIDVSSQIDAVTRAVSEGDRDGIPVHALHLTRRYDAPLEEVWDSLTNAQRIVSWFLPISGDLVVGGAFRFEGNASGMILTCDPLSSFEVTWEHGGSLGWLSVEMEREDEEATRLKLEHTAPATDETWREYGPGATGIGWEQGLLGLALHLRGTRATDAGEALAWAGSEEGKEFIRQSSDRWAEAAIAAGGDPETTYAAAARAAAAYAGDKSA